MTRKKHGTKKFLEYYGKWFQPCPECERSTTPYFGKTTKDGYLILIYRCHECPQQWTDKQRNPFDKGQSLPWG